MMKILSNLMVRESVGQMRFLWSSRVQMADAVGEAAKKVSGFFIGSLSFDASNNNSALKEELKKKHWEEVKREEKEKISTLPLSFLVHSCPKPLKIYLPPSSSSALKKELKKKHWEEVKREEKEKVAAISSAQSPMLSAAEDYDIDPTKYYENRVKYLASQEKLGINQYAHKFQFLMHVEEYIKKYISLSPGQHLKDVEVNLAGRIMNKRISSSKLYFYDLYGDSMKVQVMADARDSDLNEVDFSKLHTGVRRGDIVTICGFPGKSKRGELSIFPKKLVVLSHCLHMMPRKNSAFGVGNPPIKKHGVSGSEWVPGLPRNPEEYVLKDQGIRYRQRYMDLLLNPEVIKIFKTRDKIISFIREYLKNLGFLEVVTPILNMIASGAAAKPFVTYHNDFNMKLFLRIAPELYLKQLIVGDFERVYEIGKQFRNEGIDSTHNPEFTTCEFYMAYADYYDFMVMAEQILSGIAKNLCGGYKIQLHSNGVDKELIEIDFTPPFRRIDMIEELERTTKLKIPNDLSSDAANKFMLDACAKFNITCPPPQTTSRLLDKLVDHFIVETCVNPSFIMNHPKIMSPLAKEHRSRPGLTERFELFINKFEVCNAYTELDDPVEQRKRFAEQLKSRQIGDAEAMALDEEFCAALEYGLPPSAGLGFGIDRLTMLFTDSHNIKEVILFPIMKPQDNPSCKEPDKLQMENSCAFIRGLVDAARLGGRNVLRKLSANIKLPAEDKLAKKFSTGSRVVSESAKARAYLNRPLSPHLPLKKPQLTATHSIPHRILGVGVASAVLLFPLATRFSVIFGI